MDGCRALESIAPPRGDGILHDAPRDGGPQREPGGPPQQVGGAERHKGPPPRGELKTHSTHREQPQGHGWHSEHCRAPPGCRDAAHEGPNRQRRPPQQGGGADRPKGPPPSGGQGEGGREGGSSGGAAQTRRCGLYKEGVYGIGGGGSSPPPVQRFGTQSKAPPRPAGVSVRLCTTPAEGREAPRWMAAGGLRGWRLRSAPPVPSRPVRHVGLC